MALSAIIYSSQEVDRPRYLKAFGKEIYCDVAMFRTKHVVQVGDRFKRRSYSRKVYAVECFFDLTDRPRHVRLVGIGHRDSRTMALSALVDGSVFEPVKG
jgi:hypothetical protein